MHRQDARPNSVGWGVGFPGRWRDGSEQIGRAILQRFDARAVSPLKRDRWSYYFAKRLLDLILAAVALVLVAPLMLLIALLIRLDSPGPAIFTQKRVGGRRWTLNGYAYWQRFEFTCYKFRTMVDGADPETHRAYIEALIEGRVGPGSVEGAKFKLSEDARITRVGRILRKTSLDELPQLINVIRGEMSLVGPRPDVPYSVELYKPGWDERLASQPGITGIWQTHGRGDVPFSEMVRMDIEYVRNSSLWLDIRTLVLTIPAVLTGRGAA